MRRLLIILLLIPLFSFGQRELLPTVAWRTYVRNVEQLTDSTYKFEVMPLDWNQPGAANIDYGNYFQDYGGNKYEVIDSAYLSVTVLDVFEHGVSPQVDRIGVMYQTPEPNSKFLAPINYKYLDETALDNARAVELAYLWRQANLYAQDSAYLVWWKDTITDISTRYDIDTLHQKTIDSILIHRTEIDELKNQSDSISATLLDWATSIEAQSGVSETKMMNPARTAEQITLNQVPYIGAKEDVYLNGFKLVADSVIVQSVRTWMDSLILHGNVHVTDTLSARKLRLTDGYTEGYYLKVNSDGNIVAQAISGALIYQGTWDASTNTPTLTDGVGTNGYYYRVVVGDTINLGSGDIIFDGGDDVLYNGTTWERIPGVGYTLQAATETHLGGVKIGANINVETDGTISITKQTLTAGTNAGQLSISEGNSVTINVDDADHSSTNELQSLTWNETTGNLSISLGTGDNLDGRYTLITDWQSNNVIVTNRLDEHSDSLIQLFTENDIQSDSISDLWIWNEGQDDTIKINSDNIDVLAGLIADIETIAELATVLEAQAGVSDKLMTALRTAEQLTLNAVPYYNVKEDIYSNFDATFDSIFASNLYKENVSVDVTGAAGVYDKEVSTNNIEVYLNGVLQRENVNYIQTETQITFIKAPKPDDYITIKYKQ